MMSRRVALAGLTLLLCLCAASTWSAAPQTATPTPIRDQEFWTLIQTFSEPDGFFNSDNLVSNEDTFQTVIPELVRTVRPGTAYLGVGPDQNFTYIVAVKPRIAFITDVRRGNLLVQLMYKALIELSPDRAEFLARLFSRPVPAGLDSTSSAERLLTAFVAIPADRALFTSTLAAVRDRLRVHHGFRLTDDDMAGIEFALSNFYRAGAQLAFVSNNGSNRSRYPSFLELHTSTDAEGVNHSYLASEDRYRTLKAYEDANLIIPIVGNFSGPKALRAVGTYLKAHGLTVGAFYASNVENYLFQDRVWDQFRANLEAQPIDRRTTIIRSCFNMSCASPTGSRAVSLLDSMSDLLKDAADGRIQSYWDILRHSHP